MQNLDLMTIFINLCVLTIFNRDIVLIQIHMFVLLNPVLKSARMVLFLIPVRVLLLVGTVQQLQVLPTVHRRLVVGTEAMQPVNRTVLQKLPVGTGVM